MESAWKESLHKQLVEEFGSAKGGTLNKKYANAFPSRYAEDCSEQIMMTDIHHIENLSDAKPIDLHFYVCEQDHSLHLRIFQLDKSVPLSDMLPMLENMGLRVFDERPYQIILKDTTIWISDFTVTYQNTATVPIEEVKDIFQEAFLNTYLKLAENDGFNKLVLGAQLSWREITILRAYAKYMHQIRFRFSQQYIEQTLANNSSIAKSLILFFTTKFDPEKTHSDEEIGQVENTIITQLENVTSLDEDRILRTLLNLMKATLRTNYYQTLKYNKPKEYLSFKLLSHSVPNLPLPAPLFEIYIYSPRFEVYFKGIELANGFHELQDSHEQAQRFETDLAHRKKHGLHMKPVDKRFLAALAHGLPDCAGVALGIDRLMMLAFDCQNVADVISFDFARA